MSLKNELLSYADDIQHDYDPEEIENFIEMVNEIENDDCSDMSRLSQKLILRLINNDELYDKVDLALPDEEDFDDDPFAD